MNHNDKPFHEMTLAEISAELVEHYREAMTDPIAWVESDDDFLRFSEASTAMHKLLEAMHFLRYQGDEAPWRKQSDAEVIDSLGVEELVKVVPADGSRQMKD